MSSRRHSVDERFRRKVKTGISRRAMMHRRVSTDEHSLVEWSQLRFTRDGLRKGCVNGDGGKSARRRVAAEG